MEQFAHCSCGPGTGQDVVLAFKMPRRCGIKHFGAVKGCHLPSTNCVMLFLFSLLQNVLLISLLFLMYVTAINSKISPRQTSTFTIYLQTCFKVMQYTGSRRSVSRRLTTGEVDSTVAVVYSSPQVQFPAPQEKMTTEQRIGVLSPQDSLYCSILMTFELVITLLTKMST